MASIRVCYGSEGTEMNTRALVCVVLAVFGLLIPGCHRSEAQVRYEVEGMTDRLYFALCGIWVPRSRDAATFRTGRSISTLGLIHHRSEPRGAFSTSDRSVSPLQNGTWSAWSGNVATGPTSNSKWLCI